MPLHQAETPKGCAVEKIQQSHIDKPRHQVNATMFDKALSSCRPYPCYFGLHQCLAAGWCAPIVVAGLKGHIRSGALCLTTCNTQNRACNEPPVTQLLETLQPALTLPHRPAAVSVWQSTQGTQQVDDQLQSALRPGYSHRPAARSAYTSACGMPALGW